MENTPQPLMTGNPTTLTESVTAPQVNENTPRPTPSNETPPQLALWELIRKEENTPATPLPADETDRVLSSTRLSIWDLD